MARLERWDDRWGRKMGKGELAEAFNGARRYMRRRWGEMDDVKCIPAPANEAVFNIIPDCGI